MKNLIFILLSIIILSSCSNENNSGKTIKTDYIVSNIENSENKAENINYTQSGSKILIAYFTWSDNTVVSNPSSIDPDAETSASVLSPGNAELIATWIQEETGGDLFTIRVTDPYPSDWDACLDRANQERGEDARPELEERVDNLDDYDTVFLGYPNWWYGVPMPLLTFLEENDLSGKEVYLFCSHGTGGLANSVEIITEAAPDAIISDNIFDCYEEEASSSQEEIQNWVEETGYSAQDR